MKKILVILITVITLAQTNRAGAQVYGSISFNTFYNELSPYGRWVNDLDYGQVWIANEPGFEPYYSNGHWVYTSYGWTWVSNYRWGWAPFHYGRWTYLPSWGEWAWVPGYQWGPAWVGWCQNDGYYGWAPLGPGMGLNFTFNTIPRNHWRFVQQQYITVPSVRNHIIRPGRNERVFRNAVVINNTQVNNNVRYEAGPQREAVERVTRRKIEPRSVAFTAADEQTKVDNRAVRIYRPELKQQQAANNTAVKPAPDTQPAVAPARRPALPATRPDERPITRDKHVKPVPDQPDRNVTEERPVRKVDEPKQVTAPVQRNNQVQQLPPQTIERPDNLRQQRLQQAEERRKQAELQRANEQQNLPPQRVQRDELKVRQAQQEQLRRQQQEQEAQQQRQNEIRRQQLEQQQARQQAMQQQKEQEQQQLRQQQLQEQKQRQNELRQQQNEQRQNELRQQQQERQQQQRQLQQRQNEMRQEQRIQPPPRRQERIVPMNQTAVRKPHGNG